jgi:hypothetical protein
VGSTAVRRTEAPNEQEWSRLEELATAFSTEGFARFAPSAGQVAGILLSIALRSLTPEQPSQEQPSQHG